MIVNQLTNMGKPQTSHFKYFTFISSLYTTLLIISVLLPYKIISLFGFIAPGGIFIFPFTYLLGGAIAEIYGRNMAVKMVLSAVTCLAIFNLVLYIIVRIPSPHEIPNQDVFMKAFGSSIRLFLGCLFGLICSDLSNVYRITKLRAVFKGKYFGPRCLWTTAISEGIFNIITYLITYYGIMPNIILYRLLLVSWCIKMIYSLIMIIPILYLMKILKKAENVNIYDVKKTSGLWPELVLLKFFKGGAFFSYRVANP